MKKSTKLLSILLAIVMVFSTMSIAASAYTTTWPDLRSGENGNKLYSIDDQALASRLNDEERAAWVCDQLDILLAGLGMPVQEINAIIATITLDLTSVDGLGKTIDSVAGLADNFLVGLLASGTIITDLNFDGVKGKDKIERSKGDTVVISKLFSFLDKNIGALTTGKNGLFTKNGLNLGSLVGGFLPGDIKPYLSNLTGELKKMIAGLILDSKTPGLPNGIGADTRAPYAADQPISGVAAGNNMDANIKALIKHALGFPSQTAYATAAGDNDIIAHPEAYGATAAMIHQDPRTDRYYIYGTQNEAGDWTFSEVSSEPGEVEPDKQYILKWNDAFPSVVLPAAGEGSPAVNVSTIVENAYNGTDNLYAFVNRLAEQLFNSYGREAINDGGWGLKKLLKDAAAGEPIYDEFNWEYEVGDWASIFGSGWSIADSDIIAQLNVIIDNLLNAMFNSDSSVPAEWNPSDTLSNNAGRLVKTVLKGSWANIFVGETAPADADIDAMNNEQILVKFGTYFVPKLIPALVLPHSYTYKMDGSEILTLEEGIVYCVREFIAEILPELSWDGEISAAAAMTERPGRDNAFLDIALDMGLSIATYYLGETIGMTFNYPADLQPTQGSGWNGKLNRIIDCLLAAKLTAPDYGWVAGLLKPVKDLLSGTDGLAKLSTILDNLLPSLLKLLGGCQTSGHFDANLLLGKLKDVLNGNLDPLFDMLHRQSGTVCDKALFPAAAQILTDLVGATSLRLSNDYSNEKDKLKENLTKALSAENPIDNLFTYQTLGPIVRDLLYVVVDPAGYPLWLYDLLAIVIQAVGALNSIQYNGTDLLIDPTYFGDSVEVKPKINPKLLGFADGYGNPAYQRAAGNFTQYSSLSIRFIREDILNLNGASVQSNASAKDLSWNEIQDLTALTFSPPAGRQLYKLKVQLHISGSIGGTAYDNDVLVTKPFVAGKEAYDDDSANKYDIVEKDKSISPVKCKDYYWRFGNVYLDETEALSVAETVTMDFHFNGGKGKDKNKGRFRIEGLDPMPPARNEDGSINQTCSPTGNVKWKVAVNQDLSSTEPNRAELDFGGTIPASLGVSTTLQSPRVPFYFGWDKTTASWLQDNGLIAGTSQVDAVGPQWVADGSVKRAGYDADFIAFEFSVPNGFTLDKDGKSATTVPQTGKPVIILYNSYGMNALVRQEIARGRESADYASGWDAYVSALNDALGLYYTSRNAADFVRTRQWMNEDAGEWDSKYELYFNALKAAIEGLVLSDAPSQNETILTGLNGALGAKPAYSIRDYILYRWNIYNNKLAELQGAANSCIAPKRVRQDDDRLLGVPDDSVAEALAETAGEGYAAQISAMITHPSGVEEADNEDVRRAYKEPALDAGRIDLDLAKLNAYEARLEPDRRRAACKAYLNDAINNVVAIAWNGGANTATGAAAYYTGPYTPESWAEFEAKHDAAVAVADSGTSTPNEIFDARYYLLVAYKALVPVTQELDMTEMDEKIAMAQDIFANPDDYEFTAPDDNLTLTEEQAKQALFEALGYKTAAGDYLGGGATAVAQADKKGLIAQRTAEAVEFSDSEAALAKALEPFTPVAKDPELIGLEAKDGNVSLGTGQVCRDYNGGKYIYGVAPGTTAEADLNKFFGATNDGSLEWVAPAGGTLGGTGTIVRLKNSRGEYVKGEEYTLILFGDVDGTASIDGTDVGMVKLAADLIPGSIPTAAGMLAADVDGTASIDGTDVGMVKLAANLVPGAIDQNIGFPPAA